MRFFLDENLSPKIARALDALGSDSYGDVHHLVDKFPLGTPDAKWLAALATEGDWCVISGDQGITRNAHERQAWIDAHLTAFFLDKSWRSLRLWDQAWKLVQRWPSIAETAGRITAGTGFRVSVRSQALTVIFSP